MRITHIILGLITTSSLVMPLCAGGAELSGRDIMERNFQAERFPQMHNNETMNMISPDGAVRTRKLSSISKLSPNGIDTSLRTTFEQPADIRGTVFLQIQHSTESDDLWVYLPGLKKVRRLTSGNKKDSFFGSEFSYGDLLVPAVDTFTHTLLRTEVVAGDSCYVVESKPATPQAADDVGYALKRSWILTTNFHEKRIEYYDAANRLLKSQYVSQIQEISTHPSRWWAMQREMLNARSGYRTVIIFDRLDTQTPVSDDVFSAQSLNRGK